MKKILTFALLLSAFASHAAIFEGPEGLYCEGKWYGTVERATCNMTSTTLAPTFLVLAQEQNLDSSEVAIRLSAEANGDAEASLTSAIAKDLGVDVEDVQSRVLELEANGETVSVEAVLKSF